MGAARREALSGGLWASTAVLTGGLTAAPHHGERWVEATDPETEQTLTALSKHSARSHSGFLAPAPVLPAPAAGSPPGSDPVPPPLQPRHDLPGAHGLGGEGLPPEAPRGPHHEREVTSTEDLRAVLL